MIIQAAILGTKTGEDFYVDSEGPIFAVVGTGGNDFHKLGEQSYFNAKQFEQHGFLEIRVGENGKQLEGKFYANNGEIKDKFIIEKSAVT